MPGIPPNRSDDRPIDLRSDTVTRPTAAMRKAMAEAEVGDDVFGEDPTVRRLEERAAERVGAEAALFVPTGTMGNQIALHVHAAPGNEVILDHRSHILNYERGAMAVLSGLLPRVVATTDGALTPESVAGSFQVGDVSHSRTGLIALENTHNMAGGRVFSSERGRAVQRLARAHGIPVHLDGARVFNAAAALGVPVAELTHGYDSVMFCLSKGLGAPAGSMLCGSVKFVARARLVRKMFGGGMRQAGVLAAAGIVALEQMVERLSEDHRLASELARRLGALPGLELECPPESNILMVRMAGGDTSAADSFVASLARAGVLVLAVGAGRVRFVTHHDLPRNTLERTVAAAAAACSARGG